MTEQELDLFMRNVLLDAIALDEETNTETIPYTPSLHHQKQIKVMLKNPLRWARDRKQPVWKRALKRVAVILLVISLAFGSLMVVSPTARATFIRWVTEWYETHPQYAGRLALFGPFIGQRLFDELIVDPIHCAGEFLSQCQQAKTPLSARCVCNCLRIRESRTETFFSVRPVRAAISA